MVRAGVLRGALSVFGSASHPVATLAIVRNHGSISENVICANFLVVLVFAMSDFPSWPLKRADDFDRMSAVFMTGQHWHPHMRR